MLKDQTPEEVQQLLLIKTVSVNHIIVKSIHTCRIINWFNRFVLFLHIFFSFGTTLLVSSWCGLHFCYSPTPTQDRIQETKQPGRIITNIRPTKSLRLILGLISEINLAEIKLKD